MERDALVAEWEREQVEPFAGWDFSHLARRMIEQQPPWSYEERVRKLLRETRSVLDLGTGGGERLHGVHLEISAEELFW